jgi:hypothetical protein
METTYMQGDKGKRPTKASASIRREKAAENPRKQRRHKSSAQYEAAENTETAHPMPEHHQLEDMEEETHCDDVIRD